MKRSYAAYIVGIAQTYLVSMDHDADLFCTSVSSGQHCLVRAAGNTLFQYELLAGVALSF